MSEKVKKACELCKEQPATVLCSECCKCYCDRCDKTIHGILKGHKTEAIPEGVVVDAMCPLHKNNPLEMFCVDEVKLCCFGCKLKDLHKGHNVVDLSDVSKDNETFSASDVRKHFAVVLKSDDELDKKIEEAIENIRREGVEASEKVKQTFIEAHKKLEEEEAKVMEELERVCNESEEVLQKNLDALEKTREYSKVLNEADSKGKEMSRLMELSIVCSMEEQRRTMEELHRTMMTDLKIVWDSEGRKLSFTKTLINGAPIPNNITFPSILSTGMNISWDCDLSRMSEEDKKKVSYVVEVKKGAEEERGWREVYSGSENKCSVSGLDKDSEYNVRVKCVIGGLQGGWSDVVGVKTKNETKIDSSILSQEGDGETFKEKLSEWCGTNHFELLYQGTRDGFGASDFHRACDNRGKTLTLIKNSSGHVFGGFASIPWTSSSGEDKQAPGSFIFTLTNMYGIQPTKLPLENENDSHAVCLLNSYGPIWGNGRDIAVHSNCNQSSSSWSSFPESYNDTTGKGRSIFSSSTGTCNFQVKEIEVFRVNV